VVAVPNEPGVYRLRALEVETYFDLVDALKAGDIHVQGAANYGALTDDSYPRPKAGRLGCSQYSVATK
jgi:hypothetical protein